MPPVHAGLADELAQRSCFSLREIVDVCGPARGVLCVLRVVYIERPQYLWLLGSGLNIGSLWKARVYIYSSKEKDIEADIVIE